MTDFDGSHADLLTDSNFDRRSTNLSFFGVFTFNEVVTGHSEIGKAEVGEILQHRKNTGKSRVSGICKSPTSSLLGPPIGLKIPNWGKWGGKWGTKWGGKWEKSMANRRDS